MLAAVAVAGGELKKWYVKYALIYVFVVQMYVPMYKHDFYVLKVICVNRAENGTTQFKNH